MSAPFPALGNDRFLRALRREPVDRTPVWIMRQAGRYLPEYRATRAEAGDFMALCGSPELATEVTLQPLRRFDLDAAILFSDILTVPDAMGLGLYFEAGEGPRFRRPLDSVAAIRKLAVPDIDSTLGYVLKAVTSIRHALDGRVPLIGFAGSPWTVATYAVEGGSSKNFSRIKALLYDEPAAAKQLLDTLADATARYLNAQIAAGAQAVMIFDTWGGVLEPSAYRNFSLAPMQRVVDQLERDGVPVVLFTKGAGERLAIMADTGCDALGVDWTTDLARARELTGDRVALQGNLDPSVLYASPATIRDAVKRVLESYGTGPGHVFNLGHGIHPDIDPAHVAAMVAAVHELSPAFNDQR
ncbi:MAG: uroporphyrinogen decarboxylase [Pseudomonadota bacterium]